MDCSLVARQRRERESKRVEVHHRENRRFTVPFSLGGCEERERERERERARARQREKERKGGIERERERERERAGERKCRPASKNVRIYHRFTFLFPRKKQ